MHRRRRNPRRRRAPQEGPEGTWAPIEAIPADNITGMQLYMIHSELERTCDMPCGIWEILDPWKTGRLRGAGMRPTPEMLAVREIDSRMNLCNFITMERPCYLFKAFVVLDSEGRADMGWVSPTVKPKIKLDIQATLDPAGTAIWTESTCRT